jgi:hypothetical protein
VSALPYLRPTLALLLACCAWLAAAVPARAHTLTVTTLASSAPGAATTGSLSSSSTAALSNTPVPVAPSEVPYPGRRMSSDEVLRIAEALPVVRRERARSPGAYGGAYLKGPGRWQVSFFSRRAKEIVQVYIADATGRVLEQWTGFQVAWTMARGYPGAFGRHVNSLYVWLPLCVLFFVPFFNWRRPFSLLHLDLLVLLFFGVSLAFFNHARIGLSVPLVYPPLLYLLARMLALARPRLRAEATPLAPAPGLSAGTAFPAAPPLPRGAGLRLLVPPLWLALGVVFLLGFRVALNVTDSNVIDVGYAGVIGAQRIASGRPLYGAYPADNEHGDTYGPVNYEAYVPFQQALGWSGQWDDLPAAHAAAILFDLLAVALLFLLGRRVRGPTLGIALAYAWVSYPFTLYALESNSNDTLVCVLVLAALLCATSAPTRGVFAALAGLTKFAPLALAPLLATHGLRELPGRGWSGRLARARALGAFGVAFALTAAVVSIPALTHDSWHTIYERTLAYQSNRGSPFSVWGLYGGLGSVQLGVEIAAIVLAVALAVVPRRPDVVGLAAAAAAIVIATQLGVEHWFYLYVPWFFGLVVLALLGRLSDPEVVPGQGSGACGAEAGPFVPTDRSLARPVEEPLTSVGGAASAPARSSPPAAAPSSGLGRPSATGPLLRSQTAPASA